MELILAKPLLAIFLFLAFGFLFGFLSRQATIDDLRIRLGEKPNKDKDLLKEVRIDVVYEGNRIVKWLFNDVNVSTSSNTSPFGIAQYFSSWYCATYNIEKIDNDIQPITRRINDAVETRVSSAYRNSNVRVLITIYETGGDGDLFCLYPDGDRAKVV